MNHLTINAENQTEFKIVGKLKQSNFIKTRYLWNHWITSIPGMGLFVIQLWLQPIFTNSIKEQEKRHQMYEIVYTIMNQAHGPKKAVKRLNMDFWLINIFFALTRIAIMVFFYSG